MTNTFKLPKIMDYSIFIFAFLFGMTIGITFGIDKVFDLTSTEEVGVTMTMFFLIWLTGRIPISEEQKEKYLIHTIATAIAAAIISYHVFLYFS